MANYTVIIDDSDSRIIYGPGEDSWGALTSTNSMYQGTAHYAMSPNAVNMSFSFVGGQEVFVKGNFVGSNNVTDSTTYPTFQVDLKTFLNCFPNPPQNGGQFVCSTSLPSTIANHTMTMFVDPNAAIQQFYIDYIRHGSGSQAAQNANETVVYVKAPDNTTPGLSFNGGWKYQSIWGTDDSSKTMQTSTASSSATYRFVGDSFTLWACCMSITTSSNAAEVTYSIDGGDTLPVQIDETFIQSAQCKDQRILFQVKPGQIQHGNHTVEVVYGGGGVKIPLGVCGLASTPVDIDILDITPQTTNTSSVPSTSTTPAPSAPSANTKAATQKLIIGTTVGGVTIFLVILVIGITWWRRNRTKQLGPEGTLRSTSSIVPYPHFYYPVALRYVAPEKPRLTFRRSTTVPNVITIVPPSADEPGEDTGLRSTEPHPGSSGLQARLPSYRTVCVPLDP